MGKWVHRLSRVDADARRADCAECGPRVPIQLQPSRGPRCRRAKAKHIPWKQGVAGLSRSEHSALLKAITACAICLDGEGLVLDHCHATNAIRGVICRRCNLGLGFFRDNPDLLETAAAYVET